MAFSKLAPKAWSPDADVALPARGGMGGELMEGKTCPFSLSTIRIHMTSPVTQRSHKAVQPFQWRQGLPPSWHAASPMVPQQDQCVTGTAGKGERKGQSNPWVRSLPGPWRGDLDGKWLS